MVYVVSRVVDSREVFSSDFFAVNAGTSGRVVPEFNTLSGDFWKRCRLVISRFDKNVLLELIVLRINH